MKKRRVVGNAAGDEGIGTAALEEMIEAEIIISRRTGIGVDDGDAIRRLAIDAVIDIAFRPRKTFV